MYLYKLFFILIVAQKIHEQQQIVNIKIINKSLITNYTFFLTLRLNMYFKKCQ